MAFLHFSADGEGQQELPPQRMQEIKDVFDIFDSRGNGSIDASQLTVAMRALGFEPKRDEINRILSDLSEHGNGTIEYDIFSKMMIRKMQQRLQTIRRIRNHTRGTDSD